MGPDRGLAAAAAVAVVVRPHEGRAGGSGVGVERTELCVAGVLGLLFVPPGMGSDDSRGVLARGKGKALALGLEEEA